MAASVLLVTNPLPLSLVTCLEDLGYAVMMAEDGRAALHHLEQRKPDLLIIDAEVLVASGLGTCTRLRSVLEDAALPVVMWSALAGLREQSTAQLIGARMTLSNPTASEVAAVVEGLLCHVQPEPARLWRAAS